MSRSVGSMGPKEGTLMLASGLNTEGLWFQAFYDTLMSVTGPLVIMQIVATTAMITLVNTTEGPQNITITTDIPAPSPFSSIPEGFW